MRPVLLLCLLLPLQAADNQLTSQERSQGWRLLFDGHTTTGWVEVTGKAVQPTSWTIVDGCLKTVVSPGGAQDIRTLDSFHDYDLEFDWKVLENGNSGVKYLIQKIDEWNNAKGRQARARGFEYQLADNRGPDAVDPARSTASLYSAIAPSPPTNPAVGSFNHSRILVKGARVEHWLNGTRVVAFELNSPEAQKVVATNRAKEDAANAIKRDTPISLQNHGTECWFKNVKIRRLAD